MASRDTLGDVYDAMAACYPSLEPEARRAKLLPQIAEDLRGFSDEEVWAGWRLLRHEQTGKRFPPSLPGDLVAACSGAARRLRTPIASAMEAGAYCGRCGATRLVHGPPQANGISRMVPDHREDCPRRQAEWDVPAAYDAVRAIKASQERKPARATRDEPRAATPLAEVLP